MAEHEAELTEASKGRSGVFRVELTSRASLLDAMERAIAEGRQVLAEK